MVQTRKHSEWLGERRRTWLKTAAAASAGALFGGAAWSQDSPQVVRMVIPYPPGNPLDAMARTLADSLRSTTKRNYVVDNKPGAGGIIGSTEVARAKPDGSVLLFTVSAHNIVPVLYSKLPFDVAKDFTPITQLAVSPGFALLVRPSSPFKTVADVVRQAKAKQESVSYGSFGAGTTTHLIGAMFALAAGVELLHVPFKGSPLTELMGGHIDLTWVGVSTAQPLIQEGKVRALAISWPNRIPDLPDVPTLAEFGYKDVDIPAWSGVYGPAGMPATIVQSIYADIVAASRRPEYAAAMKTAGAAISNMAPQQFAKLNAEELARYKKDIARLGIKLD